MPINVFDTSGFFDSEEFGNKDFEKQIASKVGYKIDMFAYLMTADKMDSNIENILTFLQEWTMGRIQIFGYTGSNFFRNT